MTNRTRSNRTAFTWLAVPALLIACADEPAVELDAPRQLSVEFNEEFHVGDDPSEHQFATVRAMALAPDGRLVVLDAEDFAVTVYDASGNQVGRWGSEGEGDGLHILAPSQALVDAANESSGHENMT